MASVPPVSRDALTHHLVVPSLYLQHGGIYEIPEIVFSYFPMNIDLLYLFPLVSGNDIWAKYIHFMFALMTSWLIFDYLKKRINHTYGLLGVLFFLSIPVISKLSITVYVDLGLIFFTTASLLLLLEWSHDGYKKRKLFFAGIACGLAAGTKYNGLIAVFLLPLLSVLLYSRSWPQQSFSNKRAIGYGFLFFVTAIIVFSPWLVKNIAWTGNPLFPLFDSWFHHNSINYTSKLSPFAVRSLVFYESPLQIFLLPLRIFFEGQDNNPQYFDGKLNPFLLILPLIAFLAKELNRVVALEKKLLLGFSVVFLSIALFQSGMRIRYIAPIIPPLVILSMFGIRNILCFISQSNFQAKSVMLNLGAVLLAVALLVPNIIYLRKLFQEVSPMSYIQGTTSREEYITKYRPEYPVLKYANNYLAPDTKTLCIFLGNRKYYMKFKQSFDVPTHQDSYLNHVVITADSVEDILTALRLNNFSHLLVRHDLTQSWANKLGEEDREKFTEFLLQYCVQLQEHEGYSLLEIL